MTIVRAAARLSARRIWLLRHRDHFASEASSDRPRLLVDISVIVRHDAQTGIQRVVRAVWSELLQWHGSAFDLVPVFASPTHGYCVAPFDFLDKRPQLSTKLAPARAGHGDVFLGLDLTAHLLPRYEMQLTAWRAAGARVSVVVYDLLPLQSPQWFNPAMVRNFRGWWKTIARLADQLLCISEQVAADARTLLEESSRERVVPVGVLRLAGHLHASVPTSGISLQVGKVLQRVASHPTILMVGTVEPRKGYDVALDAFEYLWSTQPQDAPDLVIVGKPGWKTQPLQQRIRAVTRANQRLSWLTDVSDEALAKLYDLSSAVFLASYGEGFGLPAIEAALHGKRVLVRNLPVFREHGLPNLQYFENDRPAELAASLLSLLRQAAEPCPTPALPTWSDAVTGLLQQLGLLAIHAESGHSSQACGPRKRPPRAN